MLVAPEGRRYLASCLLCGEERYVNLNGHSTDAPPVPDWRRAAVDELRTLMASTEKVKAQMAEAEKLHAALTLLGLPVPEIPWRQARPAGAKRPGFAENVRQRAVSPPSAPNCARCGKPFTVAGQTKKLADGSVVCRFPQQCGNAESNGEVPAALAVV